MTMTFVRRLAIGMVVAAALNGVQPMVAHAEQLQTERAQRDRDWQRTVRRVRAFQTDHVRVWLSAGWHRVTVVGDGDTDLDLYVRDDYGRQLAMDDDETDYCLGSFFLRRGGYVEIRVRNLGRVYNEYELDVR